MSVRVLEIKDGEEINLIESDIDGFINIWNFHTEKLLKKIDCCKGVELRGICIWDETNIFVAGNNNSINLIDIKSEKLIKKLEGQFGTICTLHKIFIPELGECLISGANNFEQIKLWAE